MLVYLPCPAPIAREPIKVHKTYSQTNSVASFSLGFRVPTDLDPYCDPCQLLAYGSNSSMTPPPPPLTLEPLPLRDPLPAPLTFLPFLSASVLWGHTYE